MKNFSLKDYALILFIALAILGVIKGLQYITAPKPVVIVQPFDTNFAAIAHTNYRPESIPFIEHPQKPKIQLPSNVNQGDVANIIVVVKKDSSTGRQDTTAIITTHDGTVYVNRDSHGEDHTQSVTIITYVPPILKFGLFPSIGVDYVVNEKLSPVGSIGLLKILGSVTVPEFSADLYGIGAGASVKVYEDISAGVVYRWNYQDAKTQIAVKLAFNF